MTNSDQNQPIADPASQQSENDDTSIVPDLMEDPVEQEKKRTEGLGAVRPDLA